MTAKEAAIQQSLLSNGFANKHVSKATMGYNNNRNPNTHECNSGRATDEPWFLCSPY
jgi:hypothetical protein